MKQKLIIFLLGWSLITFSAPTPEIAHLQTALLSLGLDRSAVSEFRDALIKSKQIPETVVVQKDQPIPLPEDIRKLCQAVISGSISGTSQNTRQPHVHNLNELLGSIPFLSGPQQMQIGSQQGMTDIDAYQAEWIK